MDILTPIEQIENGGQISRLFLVPVSLTTVASCPLSLSTVLPLPPPFLCLRVPCLAHTCPWNASALLTVTVQTATLPALFRAALPWLPAALSVPPAGGELWRRGAHWVLLCVPPRVRTHWINDDQERNAQTPDPLSEPQTWWFPSAPHPSALPSYSPLSLVAPTWLPA